MKNLEYSSKSQAENGTDNTTVMTPLRVKQSILANSSASPQAVQSDWSEGDNTSPAYIKNKPTIPTLTSQLTNDSRFVVGGVYSYQDLIGITSTSDPVYISLVNDITNRNMFSIGSSSSANAPIYASINNNGDITIKFLDNRWWLLTVNLTVNGTTVTETTDFEFLIKDLQINGYSQVGIASGVVDILTNSPYSSSNKIATMADIPSVTGNTYYFDGQNNQANVDMINEICTKFDNGEEIVFTGKFADGNINQVFEVPINITKYTTDTSFNNDSAFVSDPVFWFDPTSYDPTDPTSVPTIYYLTYALYLTGTWGNFTSVTTFRTHTMTPDAWDAKQNALVSGTNIKTINNQSLLGSGNISISGGSTNYNDLSNKPQINGNTLSGNKTAANLGFATVATSGSYNDLSNKPTIPTVNNGTLTIKRNGTQIATFSANQSGNATADISVPTLPSTTTGSLSITKTSGNSTATGTYAKYGNVVVYEVSLTTTGTTASAGDIFVGKITNFTPKINTTLVGYQNSSSIIGSLNTSQNLTVRNASARTIPNTTNINIRGTLIV